MHTWSDDALILAVDTFADHDAIVHLFTPAHGMARGIVKRGLTSKIRADLQPGTLVVVQAKARLEQHMATFTVEARHSYAARVMHDPLRLTAVGSAMSLLRTTLAEHDPHPALYHATHGFLQHVAASPPLAGGMKGGDPTPQLIWLSEYVRLELALLELAGFGLDLSCCAATGATDALVYVSPKSGRAVSQAAGLPYHDRMLALPVFMREDHTADDWADIIAGLALTGHFIETRLLAELHRAPPPLRGHFVALLQRMALAA